LFLHGISANGFPSFLEEEEDMIADIFETIRDLKERIENLRGCL
jgi:hypothetical protein